MSKIHSSLFQYRADIDGIRAVAVLLVLLFHFRIVPGSVGFIGVDIFFVISGYLITGILFRDLESERFKFLEFYVRRIRRLAPAFFFVIFLTVSIGLWLLFPSDFQQLSKQVLSAQFYISNFYFWKNVNYFGITAEASPLLHSWSLAVEEQFYLFFPILLLFIHRYFRKYFWEVLCVLGLFSLVLGFVFSGLKPGFSFYLLPTRAWELILGALIVPLELHWMHNGNARLAIAVASVGLLLVALFSYHPDIAFPGYFAMLPTMAAAGLLFSGNFGGNIVSKCLSIRPLTAIGKISYPLYLVHWPLHVFAVIYFAKAYTWNYRFFAFLASILLATLIYWLIENPIRNRKILNSKRHLLWAYSAGLLVTTAFYLVTVLYNGFPQRFPAAAVKMSEFAFDKVAPLTECEFHFGAHFQTDLGCSIGAPAQQPTWLIVGDSHAWAAHEVLDRWLKLHGITAKFAFLHSCPPLSGISLIADNGICNAFNLEIRNYLESASQIEHVMLMSTWRQFIEGRILDNSDGVTIDASKASTKFQKIFNENLVWLHQKNKTVHLWEPVPGAMEPLPEALARSIVNGKNPELRVSLLEYEKTYKFLFDAIEKNKNLISVRYSPSKKLCVTGMCDVLVDGVPLYFDNGHITMSSWPVWLQILQTAYQI